MGFKPRSGTAAHLAILLEQWIDESYRAQAPKTLVKQLDAATS